ncbi:hypothetical protein [Streptomyces sp. NPDC057877]|uniref:hypothetical protein n=1 Tax=Streptomyces sp. NPDC057877 TaxID=3346269 RepID=UPI003684A67A
MALEPGGAEQDTLALRLARPRWAKDDTQGPGDEDTVDRLAAELADHIAPAVHPYEVAALLEAEGCTADVVSGRYGHRDVFSLASALYERVPRAFPTPAATADLWRPDTVRSLPGGLLGLAAGVLVVLAGLRDPYAVIVLTVSVGPAEWLLYRCRGWSGVALRHSATPAGFRWRWAAVLGRCLGGYLLLLLAAALLTGSGPAALLALAATLWTARLSQAFGAAWPSAGICAVAAATAATLPHRLPLVCAVAALCLTGCAIGLLGRPFSHFTTT